MLVRTGGSMALLSATGLLAACKSGSDATESTTSASGDQGTPVPGGTIVFGMESPPGGYDPAKWFTDAAALTAFNVFDRLFEPQTLEPMLLESDPVVENEGTLYKFKLKEGVKFHHGRELTADDVKFSLERIVDPLLESQGAGSYTALPIIGMDKVVDQKEKEVQGIKVVDDYNFTIELAEPDSAMLYLLSIWFASIVPRDVVEKVGNKEFDFAPVGTGPFSMQDVDRSKGLTLVKNPDYWKSGKPYVDQVQWNFGVDPKLSVLRMESGEQDLMFETLTTSQISQVQANPDTKDQLVIGDTSVCVYYTLPTEHEACKDLRVRQAIAQGVDKERLVQTIKGMGLPADGGIFGPTTPYYQEGIGYDYDPEAAKALLADAGYADGFEIDYYGKNFSPFKEVGEVFGADMEKIGIKVNLNLLPFDAWLAAIAPYPPAITENFWDLAYPHGSYVMDLSFTKDGLEGCCNTSKWVDPDYDKLVRSGHAELDEEKQVEIYKETDKIPIADEALWVPAIYQKAAIMHSARMKGFEFYSPSPNTGKFFADYWVDEEA